MDYSELVVNNCSIRGLHVLPMFIYLFIYIWWVVPPTPKSLRHKWFMKYVKLNLSHFVFQTVSGQIHSIASKFVGNIQRKVMQQTSWCLSCKSPANGTDVWCKTSTLASLYLRWNRLFSTSYARNLAAHVALSEKKKVKQI